MKLTDVIRQLAIFRQIEGDLDVYIVINESLFPLGAAPWTTQRPSTPETTPDPVVVFGALVYPTPIS